MSYRRISLWLVLVLSVGSLTPLRAQFGGTVTKLGDSPAGSVYSYSYGINASWWLPGNGGYGAENYSGVAGAYSVNGSFPAGNSFFAESADTNTPLETANWSGSFTIPAGSTGAFVVARRVSGQAGYTTTTVDLGVSLAGSYDAAAPVAKKAAKLTFNNPSSVPMTYKVLNGLTELDVVTVPAGSSLTQSYGDLPDGAELSVVSTLDGYAFTDGVWVVDEGTVIEYVNVPASGPGSLSGANASGGAASNPSYPGYVLTNFPGPAPAGITPTSTTAEIVAAGGAVPASVPTGYTVALTPAHAPANVLPVMPNYPTGPVPAAPSGGSTIWSNQSGSQSDLVTNAVYRQGVDKLIAQDKASQKAVVDQLKANDANAKARDDAAKVVRDKQGALVDAVNAAKASGDSAVSAMVAQGAAAKAQAEALFGSTPTGTGWALTASGAPDLSVSMPSRFGGGTFQFNPFTPERLGPVASWFRAAMAWLTIATLGVWVWRQMGEWVRGFSSVQQAKGNPVVGGTGAQGTAFLAAGLMTVAIVAGVTTLVSWSFGEIGLSSFVASVTTNPLATIPTGALWMLDQIFPVATMVTALVARVTFNLYASTVYAGCAAVVRFIVP